MLYRKKASGDNEEAIKILAEGASLLLEYKEVRLYVHMLLFCLVLPC